MTSKQQIKEFILKGYTNKEMAEAMGLTVSGIKFHMTDILKSYGVDNRLKLMTKLFEEKHSSYHDVTSQGQCPVVAAYKGESK